MRIARVLTRLNLGGPARQVLASDPLLKEMGHELRIFAGSPPAGEGDLFDTLVEQGLDVVRVPGLGRRISIVGDLRATRFLRRELTAFAPDILHTHASKAGALGRRAARKLSGIGRVHTFHGHVLEGYFPPTVSRMIRAHERRLARATDRILAVSHATAEDLIRLDVVPEDKLVVVPPGVDLAELLALKERSGTLRKAIGAGEDALVVGVLGRLAEVKRPQRALDVFELLKDRLPHLHLVFIGDGPERQGLERRITSADDATRGRVHLMGLCTEIAPMLADLDVVLLTSRSEGMPVALIEAGAAGKPVVASPVGGVEELVAHERTGYLGETTDELAYFLTQLAENDQDRQDMGHRARLRVAKQHSAAALARRLDAVYTAVVESRP
ncbi:MAG: glycosyltransferase involved in cell wall biosynthesis [Chlamydiales bacterium]